MSSSPADGSSSFSTIVSVARLHEHQRERARDAAVVTAAGGLLLAANLALQILALTPDGRLDAERLGGAVRDSLEWVVLLGILVVQFASGAAFFVGAKLWRDATRAGHANTDELALTIDGRHVTVHRGARAIHTAAELARVTAYPNWLEFVVREGPPPTRFAIPLPPEEHRRLVAYLRTDATLELRTRGSFVASFAGKALGHSTLELALHFFVVVVAIVLVAAAFGALIAAFRYGGGLGGLAAALSIGLVAYWLRARANARMDRTALPRA